MNTIAIVVDDPCELDRLTNILKRHGHCAPFADADAFLDASSHDKHDLALIELSVPKSTQTSLVKRIRAGSRAPNLPIMLIAACGSDEDEVAGLMSGADDYVTRSVCDAVLMARVNALLNRVSVAAEHPLETHGQYRFNRSRLSVVARGREYVLTAKEFDLALLLFRNLQRPLARGVLMDHVWGLNADVSSRTLDTHICRLRTKLDLSTTKDYRISTLYKFGYRLEKLH